MHQDLQNVTLCIDFHFVNNVTVFHTISRRIDYRTVSFPLSRSKVQILAELKDVYRKYNARGFRVTEIHADKEFEKVENDVLPVRMRICGVDEHVPEIERSVQTQKNENRSTCYAMPYRCIPRLMVRELIKQGNTFLNAFGSEDTIAPGLTPRNIIDNLPHVDYNDLKYEFRQYVHLHLSQPQTNTMSQRTVGAIVLGPRQIQGQYNYMSLETGQQIDGRVVAVIPPTDDVILRVEQLGIEQKQPYRLSRMLKYEWQPGQPIGQDDSILTDDPPPIDNANAQLIVPEPVTQPPPNIHAQNSFAILADDTDYDSDDDIDDANDVIDSIQQDLTARDDSDRGAEDNEGHERDENNNNRDSYYPETIDENDEPSLSDDCEFNTDHQDPGHDIETHQEDEGAASDVSNDDEMTSDEEMTEERTQERQ
jgi:hypothetical protein